MRHAISVNPACYRWGTTIAEFVRVSRAAGFTNVEVSIQQAASLADDLGGLDALRRWRRENGVEVVQFSGIIPAGPVLPAPLLIDEARFAAAMTTLDRRLAVADALDCRRAAVVVNPCTDLSTAAAADRALSRLGVLADRADQHGIRLAVEFIGIRQDLDPTLDGERSFVRTVRDLLGLLDRVDRPDVGVLLDTAHLYASGDSLSELPDLVGRIVFVQIADIPLDARPDTLTDAQRCLPGTGIIDFPRLAADLQSAGYDGPLSLELFSPGLWRLPPGQAAPLLFDSIRTLQPQAV